MAILATVIAFGAFVTVAQVSQAKTGRKKPTASPAICPPASPTKPAESPKADPKKADPKADPGKAKQDPAKDPNKAVQPPAQDPNNGKAVQPPAQDPNKGKAAQPPAQDPNKGWGKAPAEPPAEPGEPAAGVDPADGQNGRTGTDPAGGEIPAPGQTAGSLDNGTKIVGDGQEENPAKAKQDSKKGGNADQPCIPAEIADQFLGNSCDKSKLPRHDGFQKGDRCVGTDKGEVPSEGNSPSVLIVEAPRVVKVGQPFSLKVSSRGIVRDTFVPAGKGGYYLNMSFLTADGLVRGHMHTACNVLPSTKVAPDASPVPAFFVATEDKKGGREPDTITINVTGMPATGTARCAVWLGDASHSIPMMQRANQQPGFDTVRVKVVK
jgi:hypothetical protein